MRRRKATVESIGILFACLLLCGGMGMVGGLVGARMTQRQQSQPQETGQPESYSGSEADQTQESAQSGWHVRASEQQSEEQDSSGTEQVISVPETIQADAEYILREKDLLSGLEVETSEEMPEMYIGMNREQFLAAMETYESAPPLSEKERGFVSLEVLSFAASRVVVQMNYQYVQPSESFYIVAINDLLVVYLEDRETIYQYTNIHLSQLPEQLQQEIIQVMYIEDEESLYDFLENYTS